MPTKLVKVEGKLIRVPSDATPEEIDAIANPGGGATGNSVSAQPSFFSKAGLKKAAYEAADHLTNLLPAGGGIAGGILGSGGGSIVPGPGTALGGIGGAALGGAAGEAGRQLARRAIFPADPSNPQSSTDAALNIGKEGLKQGAYEAGGRVVGKIGKAIAPKLAEAAVAPGKRMLKSMPEGAAPIGETILNKTSGFNPQSISKELSAKIKGSSDAMDNALGDAGNRGVTVPLKAPRAVVKGEMTTALEKNAPAYIQDVGKVNDQLTYEMGANGKPMMQPSAATKQGAGFTPVNVPAGPSTKSVEIGDHVEPFRARLLRQGIDTTINGWNPESQTAGGALRERIHGAFSGAIHDAVPETAALDKEMTDMIPAQQAAWNTSFNPGVTRNVVERLARPTGALVGSLAGAKTGYDQGGVAGAVIGGAGGLIIPHIMTSPSGLIGTARFMDRALPVGARIGRFAAPVIEGQMGRSKDKRPSDDEQ